MCRVVISNSKREAEYIIYNHLFSKKNYRFTIPQLVGELQEYKLNLSQEYVQAEIDEFVEAGLIHQKFRTYSTCSRQNLQWEYGGFCVSFSCFSKADCEITVFKMKCKSKANIAS